MVNTLRDILAASKLTRWLGEEFNGRRRENHLKEKNNSFLRPL